MIKYYRVQNFKGLTDVELNLGWINVLIGPNTSGKTSILESVDFLQAFLEPSIDLYLQKHNIDLGDLRNKYSKKKIISYEVIFELINNQENQYGGDYHYIVEYNTETNRINKEQLYYFANNVDRYVLLKRDIKSFEFRSESGEEYKGEHVIPSASTLAFMSEEYEEKFPEINYFKANLHNIWSFFIWDPKLLRKASREEDGLGKYGERLASTLYSIKKTDEETYRKIIKTIKKNLPFVEDVEIQTKRAWKELVLVERYSDGNTYKFSPTQLSDGTLRILALAVIRHAYAGGTITLEEPENGIYPKLVRNTVDLLKELTVLKKEKRCQVIFTTHSPYVLDEFYEEAFSAVYVIEKGNSAQGTIVKKLGADPTYSDKKKIADLLFNQSLGELWYSGHLEGGGK